MAEALGWTPDNTIEADEKKKDRDEDHKAEEREKAQQGHRVQVSAKAATPANESKGAQAQPQKQQTPLRKGDAFQAKQQPQADQAKPKPVSDFAAVQKLGATQSVTAAKTIEAAQEAAERQLKSGKPPDAFTLLNAAQPHGVFFKEDYEREGTTEGKEDPELAAAVEETIGKMFGVKGILRVGPGRNQADEPVVVIVVAQGFGEASMRQVPEMAGRFPTLTALPFDVLPLKKER
jgi:hypothetical protein